MLLDTHAHTELDVIQFIFYSGRVSILLKLHREGRMLGLLNYGTVRRRRKIPSSPVVHWAELNIAENFPNNKRTSPSSREWTLFRCTLVIVPERQPHSGNSTGERRDVSALRLPNVLSLQVTIDFVMNLNKAASQKLCFSRCFGWSTTGKCWWWYRERVKLSSAFIPLLARRITVRARLRTEILHSNHSKILF